MKKTKIMTGAHLDKSELGLAIKRIGHRINMRLPLIFLMSELIAGKFLITDK